MTTQKAAKDEADAELKVAQTQVPVQNKRVSTSERQVGAAASNLCGLPSGGYRF